MLRHLALASAIIAGTALASAARAQDGTPGPTQRESSGQAFDLTPENAPSPPPAERPKYQLTRWLEDWRALQDPAKRTDFLDPLKYIQLDPTGSAHLTLSGQLREDLVSSDGSLLAGNGDTFILHRLYLGADLHIGQARLFAELADTLAIGQKGPPGPTDEDQLDAQLLFADYRLDVGSAQLIGRIGRQELAFDPTQRFVGVREGPNNRQAFDGARVNLKAKTFYISAFVSRPVTYRRYAFDDVRNPAVSFRGIYATHAADGQTQSVYVYGFDNDEARFGDITGRERRTALGARVAGKIQGIDYDFEGMRQTGSFAGERINAWGVATVAGYTLSQVGWQPRLGVQADWGSGDSNPRDHRVTTFNPLFFKAGYFTEAPIASFANVRHLKASASFRPTTRDTFSLAYADFTKLSLGDAVYAIPLVALGPTRGMIGRHVGNYAQFVGSHQFDVHFSLSLEAVHFERSEALRAVGGRNIDYAKLTANFLF